MSKYFDVLDNGVFSHGALALSFMVLGALTLCHVDADPLLVVNASEVYRPPSPWTLVQLFSYLTR